MKQKIGQKNHKINNLFFPGRRGKTTHKEYKEYKPPY